MRHKRQKARIAVCILAVAATLGCSRQSLEQSWATQEERIDSFIQSLPAEGTEDELYAHEVIYNGGSARIVMREGSGEGLARGGTVSFYYTGYVFNGNIDAGSMFATNDQQAAADNGWGLTDAVYEIKTVTLGPDDGLVPGLHNGLAGVRTGEVCYIVFSGQYGFGKKPVGVIPGNSAILYQITVESVSNQ